jgi:beta-N-acetylhexosaminidase
MDAHAGIIMPGVMLSRILRRELGQLFIVGFGGTSIPPELRSIAREFDLGGVIFFARNVETPEQIAGLGVEAGELARGLPLWISVDQEGGRVARLRSPFTEWPPMMTLGRSGSVDLAHRFARALAVELRAVGVTLDFAPVLDVHTNPHNPVIGDRALSDRAEDVARLGRAIVETLQAEGIAACGKHFPGHGDTLADSHHDLPVVEHEPERLRRVELVPFRAAIAAGVASIMTAHVVVSAFDESQPATLSPAIVGGLLREELGFDGLIVSDDLEMRAIADRYPPDRAAALAIAAGCDCLLVCGADHERQMCAIEGIIRAVESEEVPVKRVEAALGAQRRSKERFLVGRRQARSGAPLRALIGRAEHQAIAEEMARHL